MRAADSYEVASRGAHAGCKYVSSSRTRLRLLNEDELSFSNSQGNSSTHYVYLLVYIYQDVYIYIRTYFYVGIARDEKKNLFGYIYYLRVSIRAFIPATYVFFIPKDYDLPRSAYFDFLKRSNHRRCLLDNAKPDFLFSSKSFFPFPPLNISATIHLFLKDSGKFFNPKINYIDDRVIPYSGKV